MQHFFIFGYVPNWMLQFYFSSILITRNSFRFRWQ